VERRRASGATASEWSDGERLRERLTAVLGTDYRRTADLGRFYPGDDADCVR